MVRFSIVRKGVSPLVPPDLKPEVGMMLEVGGAGGEILRTVVTDITDSHIVLDANPPLAGKDLTFDIELVAID